MTRSRIGIALMMVEGVGTSGTLKPGGTIVEPALGHNGTGLAMVAEVKGYQLVLVMPDSICIERHSLMRAYGASFKLTPMENSRNGAMAHAQDMVTSTPGTRMPQQFNNPANTAVQVRATAQALADFPEGVDVMITGGGHLSACGEELKSRRPELLALAVETGSSEISGGSPAPHPIQFIGAGFIPGKLNMALLDGVIQFDGAPLRSRKRHAGGHSLRRQAGDDRPAAFRSARQRGGAGLQPGHRGTPLRC